MADLAEHYVSDWDPEAFTRGLIAPTDPAWIRNIAADPNVTVQAEERTFDARATIAEGADREQLWDRHVEARPEFADSPEKAGRVIPMAHLTPVS